jgi:hypothetical protein
MSYRPMTKKLACAVACLMKFALLSLKCRSTLPHRPQESGSQALQISVLSDKNDYGNRFGAVSMLNFFKTLVASSLPVVLRRQFDLSQCVYA